MAARICTHPWESAADAFKIAGNLYFVGNTNVSSHLIDTGAGLILLDTAFPQTLYLLLESIRRLGFDPRDIKQVLHTHAHYDHFGGSRAILELTGARACLGKADLDVLESRPELSWAPEYGVPFHEVFNVDTPLEDGDVIELGDTRVECVGAPGHTPGTIAFFFEVEEAGKRHRVGLHGGPGLNTLTDAYMAKNDLPMSRRDDYRHSLEKLRQRRVDIIIGAHPGQSHTFEKQARRTGDANPFVDPKDWPDFIDSLEKAARKQFA